MPLFTWALSNREELREVLPDAVVLVPVGAVEQHGPHLPTGTDILVADSVTQRAAELASDRGVLVVVAPAWPYGASDHHLMYGGTLSLRTQTFVALLADLFSALAAQGARRVVVVNGHGGNIAPIDTAAAQASVETGLLIAHVDYWRLVTDFPVPTEPPGLERLDPVWTPGHAGRFETALVAAVVPGVAAPTDPRPDPPVTLTIPGAALHSTQVWRDIEGHSDDPSLASTIDGAAWLEVIADRLAGVVEQLADVAVPSRQNSEPRR